MRPHTRTQCTQGNQCPHCCPKSPQSSSSSSSSSSMSTTAAMATKTTLIVQLPVELLIKIVSYMSFKEISQLRLVSRRFNEICSSILDSTFHKMQTNILQRYETIKRQMPRRESQRRNHPLAQEVDVIETLHMRLTLLQMTFGKHIFKKHVCFFPGEILDEVRKIQTILYRQPLQQRPFKLTEELFDLSTMAMEYFKDHIEPRLPEIASLGLTTKRRCQSGSASTVTGETTFSSRASVAGSSTSEAWSIVSGTRNSKRLAPDNGSNYGFDEDEDDDVDSCDFYVSPTPTYHTEKSLKSSLVLNMRVRRIKNSVKKNKRELVEMRRELKACKAKIESQSKQVQDYSERLSEYDNKFDETSKKFQTLLTELNKCRTEMHYWRSKSMQLLALPSTCGNCDAPLRNLTFEGDQSKPEENPFLFEDLPFGHDFDYLKNMAEQHQHDGPPNLVLIEGSIQQEAEARPSTSGETTEASVKTRSRPNSPLLKPISTKAIACLAATPLAPASRKRRSREECDEMAMLETTRKSLRRFATTSSTTRAKRPKTAIPNQ